MSRKPLLCIAHTNTHTLHLLVFKQKGVHINNDNNIDIHSTTRHCAHITSKAAI